MVIKGKIRILKWEDKQKSHVYLTKGKATRRREKSKERKRRKKRKKKEKEKNKGMFFFFCMESSVFRMSRVIGVIARVFLWRFGCSKPRVLVERSHKTLIC